jgi:uncharacterized membrane protein YhaH (DUF805 family)
MEAIPPSEEQERPSKGSIGRGIAIAVLCEFGFLVVESIVSALKANSYFVYILMFWGVIPLVALIPLFIIQVQRGHSRTANGILIIGSIAFLLNAACDAIVGIRIPHIG